MIQNNNSEKHCISARRLRRIRSKKARKLLVCLTALLCMALVGATVAFLVTQTGQITNTFQGSKVACAVIENGNNTDETSGIVSVSKKENVQIKNTGDTTAYIRAAVIITWKDSAGNVYAQKPSAKESENDKEFDYSITYNLGNESSWDKEQWYCATDGFYYYTSPVAVGNYTKVLITSCTQEKSFKADDGMTYTLSVEIIASAIQALPETVVEEQWGVAVKNGIITGKSEAGEGE